MFTNYIIHTYNNLHGASLQLKCGVPEDVCWLNQKFPNSFSPAYGLHQLNIGNLFHYIYHGTVHLLPKKVADIYRMISIVKSLAASLYLSLIISFRVTCCSSCSSFITSSLVLLFFFTRRSFNASSIDIFVIFLIFEK